MNRAHIEHLINICIQQFEDRNPDKEIKRIGAEYKEATIENEGEMPITLTGKTDGLVFERETENLIGIFRVKIQYADPTINDDDINYTDRLQLYMFLYETERAFSMTINDEPPHEVEDNFELNIEQHRIDQLLGNLRTVLEENGRGERINVTGYLELRLR